MDTGKRRLELLPGIYAVCRLDRDAAVPDGTTGAPFLSVTRTPHELSLVCPDNRIPTGARVECGWKVLMVEGPLEFSLTGVLASLAVPLARENIGIFALSTYDTDYLMVKNQHLAKAIQVLQAEGYEVEVGEGCSAGEG